MSYEALSLCTENQKQLNINPAFRDLIPPISKEEFEDLEKNILANGLEQPIKVWQGFIVDGHNRHNICLKHNLPFKTEELIRDNEHEVLLWIIDHQLDRRNISLYSRGKLVLQKKEELSKGKGFRSDLQQRQLHQNSGEVTAPRDNWTDRKLAKGSKISHDTLSKIAKIQKLASEEDKKALENGEKSINNVYTSVRMAEKREQTK